MGLILGLIGMGVASSIVDKITDTSREKEEIQAESRKYVSREKTRRSVAVAQIKADADVEVARTKAAAKVWSSRGGNGVYGNLYARQNAGRIASKKNGGATIRFCPYCGEGTDEGARFCKYCGSQIQ